MIALLKRKETLNAPSPRCRCCASAQSSEPGEQGFTLLETVIALVLLLIVSLGAASLFSFSVYNNSGGSDRAVALATAQQALEILRTAPFTSANTDARLNAGTVVQNNVYVNQRYFKITKEITDISATLKSIKITVQTQSIVKGWASGSGSGGTVTLMTQRTRAD